MKKEIEVTFKTITPLWTGDAWGESDNLKLTGIVGSLRWWFEALVRGMGYNACDSTSEKKCQVEISQPEDLARIQESICPVCYLFGTTGWKSRFGVRVESLGLKTIDKAEIRTRTNRHQVKGQNKYLSRFCDGLCGDFKVVFHFMPDIPEEYIILFIKLLQIINKYGMIGPKIAQGNGVCEIKVTPEEFFNQTTIKNIILTRTEFQRNCDNCPNFREFKFLILRISFSQNINNICEDLWRKNSQDNKTINGSICNLWKGYSFLPISFHIRDLLRGIWRTNTNIRHGIMGERGKGANLFVSDGYTVSDNEVEVRIVANNLNDQDWEDIKSTLIPEKLNDYLWVDKKSYVSHINIIQEISGQSILEKE